MYVAEVTTQKPVELGWIALDLLILHHIDTNHSHGYGYAVAVATG